MRRMRIFQQGSCLLFLLICFSSQLYAAGSWQRYHLGGFDVWLPSGPGVILALPTSGVSVHYGKRKRITLMLMDRKSLSIGKDACPDRCPVAKVAALVHSQLSKTKAVSGMPSILVQRAREIYTRHFRDAVPEKPVRLAGFVVYPFRRGSHDRHYFIVAHGITWAWLEIHVSHFPQVIDRQIIRRIRIVK